MEKEIWRKIPGYVNYEASTFGGVISYARGYRRLKQCEGNYNLHVSLYRNGKDLTINVGCVILMTFVGPCPDGLECCHSDGNYYNNRLDNLRWDTHQANIDDRTRHGTTAKGSRSGPAILVESDIPKIREMLYLGVFQKDIAQKFGVDSRTISEIACGRNWKHI